MSSYVLRVVFPDQRIVEFRFDPLTDQPLSLTAEAGAVYAVIDAQTHEIVDDVKLKQDGDTLVVEVEEALVARVDDFYATGQQVYFDTGLQTLSGEAQLIASSDATVESDEVVWEHANDDFNAAVGGLGTAAMVAGGAIAAATGYLLYNPVDVGGTDTSVVVFDLVGGVSSDHSNRTFDPNVSYQIYIIVDSNAGLITTTPQGAVGTWGTWAGADGLGLDDTITLVGTGTPILNILGSTPIMTHFVYPSNSNSFAWGNTSAQHAASFDWGVYFLNSSGYFQRSFANSSATWLPSSLRTASSAYLWSGTVSTMPLSVSFSAAYLTEIPAGVLTSQGLV